MNENNFEEFVKKQFENFEIKPSTGLMEKIFDKRLGRRKDSTFIYNSKAIALLLVGLILSGSWIFINSKKNNSKSVKEKTVFENSINIANANKKNTLRKPHTIKSENPSDNTNQNQAYSQEKLEKKNVIEESSDHSYISQKKHPISKSSNEDKTHQRPISKSSIENIISNTTKENEDKYLLVNNIDEINARTQELSRGRILRTSSLYYQLPLRTLKNTFYPTLSLEKAFIKPEDLRYSPIPYKRPRRLYASSIWLKEMEINLGVGKWFVHNQLDQFNEASPFSISANIRTRFKINEQFNVISGVNYLYRNSSVNYNRTNNKEILSIDTIHGFIIDPGAPPIPIVRYDSSFYTITEYYHGTGQNEYHRFSLPIGVEYNTYFGKNLIYINGGILITLTTYDRGRWIEDNNQEIKMFNGKSNQISSSLNSGYFMGLGYGYTIIPELIWIIESDFSVWNFKSNPLGNKAKTRILNVGLNTGVRWKF
ncbi:MAG: hypothetical protein J5I91_07075 [Bacteroidetes bacterium]|nr:hypothetical protein [Bacteroidota bacterium]